MGLPANAGGAALFGNRNAAICVASLSLAPVVMSVLNPPLQ